MKYINLFLKVISKIFFNSKKSMYIVNYVPTYDEDGFISSHNSNFKNDKKFLNAYKNGFKTGSSNGWHLKWRVYIACYLAKRATKIKGDFIELGTNRGLTALSIAHYTEFKKKHKVFFLVDTFNGLIENKLTNNEKIKNDKLKYNNCYEDVVNTFSNFKNIKIVKGTIPAILKSIKIKKISFLHIDLNSSISEIEAIEFLWNKMTPNSIILLDDYAYSGYGDTKKAWDKFCSKKDYEILSLPTGQGLILL